MKKVTALLAVILMSQVAAAQSQPIGLKEMSVSALKAAIEKVDEASLILRTDFSVGEDGERFVYIEQTVPRNFNKCVRVKYTVELDNTATASSQTEICKLNK